MSAGAESASLGDVATLRRWLNETRDRLATIIDEALGPQEVLGLPDLLTRLEHLLHERGRTHEAALRERDESQRELAERTAERDAAAELLRHARVQLEELVAASTAERDALRAECSGLRQALGAAQRELATRGVP
jgi:chromosome segregation ATPase